MPPAASSSPMITRERLVVAALLLITVLVRGGILWAMRDNLQQDPDAYREIAENVLAHGVYGLGQANKHDPFEPRTPLRPTAYRPPLYPILLSNLPDSDGQHVSLVLVAVVHVLLGAGTVWLTYLTARRMLNTPLLLGEGGERSSPGEGGSIIAPFVAALLVACDPILLNQQTLVMTETLATFLAVLALWCLTRVGGAARVPGADGTRSVPTTCWWNAGLAGGAIGLAALCRPTFLPWLGLVAVAMVISDLTFQISDWKTRALRALVNVAALAVAAAAVMSPWAIRNYQEFGMPILTTTHGGYTLYLGNNASFYKWLRKDGDGLPWDQSQDHGFQFERVEILLEVLFPQGTPNVSNWPTEILEDRLHSKFARTAIENDPMGFTLASLYRIRQLWSPLPNKLKVDESTGRRLLRYATAVWYCGVYALAAVGIWRLRWRLIRPPWVWGVLLCLTFTAVHTLYWCNLRMRAPLMPFVAMVAAASLLPRSVSEETADQRKSALADASG